MSEADNKSVSHSKLRRDIALLSIFYLGKEGYDRVLIMPVYLLLSQKDLNHLNYYLEIWYEHPFP
jgi:hypothetical protein